MPGLLGLEHTVGKVVRLFLLFINVRSDPFFRLLFLFTLFNDAPCDRPSTKECSNTSDTAIRSTLYAVSVLPAPASSYSPHTHGSRRPAAYANNYIT